jgi:hypothetical protein
MGQVQKLVTADSFDARGVFVPKGHIGTFDEALLNGDEAHIHEVGDFQPAMVEMAAIAPTGPNPKTPQQIPSDAQQDSAGTYALPGKTLVAEVTDKVEDRIEVPGLRDPENEAKVTETLGEIMGGAGSTTGNADDALSCRHCRQRDGRSRHQDRRAAECHARGRERPGETAYRRDQCHSGRTGRSHGSVIGLAF